MHFVQVTFCVQFSLFTELVTPLLAVVAHSVTALLYVLPAQGHVDGQVVAVVPARNLGRADATERGRSFWKQKNTLGASIYDVSIGGGHGKAKVGVKSELSKAGYVNCMQ